MQAKKMSEEEVNELKRVVEKNYGVILDFSSFDCYINRRNEVYLIVKGISEDLIKIASFAGVYFGRLKRNEKIQLSVEGSQIVGKHATKNVAILDDENLARFLEGLKCKWKELINCERNNFVLIKHGNDFFGSGILREDGIESLVPKARRVMRTIKKV
jgi:NOL1/NOP2/fmu family ribosome biogenesis protein